MELEKFVQSALVSIAKGVKSANVDLAQEGGKPVFSIKHSGWYENHADACVKFKAIVSVKNEWIQVIENTKEEEPKSELSFNVSHAYGIS
ncbi:MAG: hypothetical protein HZA95_00965 [Candidatus Vogelbacteria bacterium]|nr:hypothetical protein [Candidatus Vogelbacteria bacterium]